MKCQKSCGPRLGKSVHQLPGVVTFAYDLRFRRMIAHWKDLSEDYNSCTKFYDEILQMKFCDRNIPQKTLFRASKRLRKFRTRKTAKNSKLSKLLESCFEPAGKGGWPPISTWINQPGGKSYSQVSSFTLTSSVPILTNTFGMTNPPLSSRFTPGGG
jgi:hypothetical protein